MSSLNYIFTYHNKKNETRFRTTGYEKRIFRQTQCKDARYDHTRSDSRSLHRRIRRETNKTQQAHVSSRTDTHKRVCNLRASSYRLRIHQRVPDNIRGLILFRVIFWSPDKLHHEYQVSAFW